MDELQDYVVDVESALGVRLPVEDGMNEIYNTIYSTLAERFGVDMVETEVNFNSFSGEFGEDMLADALQYFSPIAVSTSSRLYRLLQEADYGSEDFDVIFTELKNYTDKILEAKDSAALCETILAIGFFIAGSTAAIVAVATTTLTGGALAAVWISSLLSLGAALVTFIMSVFSSDRSMTSLILNDSNKDAVIAQRYENEGKFTMLPGFFENDQLCIPRRQIISATKDGKTVEQEYAYLGIANMWNSSAFEGTEGALRFSFYNSKPGDIDIMYACPWLRDNVTGIDFSKGRELNASFRHLIDQRVCSMRLGSESSVVKGYSTVYKNRGASMRAITRFSF